jgi:hypothetical protein
MPDDPLYNGISKSVTAMPSPFPGMNPYLEHPDRWSTVHNRCIVAIADFLTPLLIPRYQVDIEKRIYQVTDSNLQLIGRSDITVQAPKQPIIPTSLANPSISTLQPIRIQLPIDDEVREAYLEIKEVTTGRVVTMIEVLSPTDKQGQERQKHEEKRRQVLSSRTHLIEIDLLRSGAAWPIISDESSSDYRVLVSRATDRPIADLYPFNLQDLMPQIPVPLQFGDLEPLLDLKELIEAIYDRSGYSHFIDYNLNPSAPKLSSTDQVWLDQLLRSAALRSP